VIGGCAFRWCQSLDSVTFETESNLRAVPAPDVCGFLRCYRPSELFLNRRSLLRRQIIIHNCSQSFQAYPFTVPPADGEAIVPAPLSFPLQTTLERREELAKEGELPPFGCPCSRLGPRKPPIPPAGAWSLRLSPLLCRDFTFEGDKR
jgi:hypothetical protein